MYEPRWYRDKMQSELATFTVNFAESDLWVGVSRKTYSDKLKTDCQAITRELYLELYNYLLRDPDYHKALTPHSPHPPYPPIAHEMFAAGLKAGVGPMAAVAGAFAQEIARQLQQIYPAITDIIIENGGDIFLSTTKTRHIAIWAGNSVLSNKLALEIAPGQSLGICTSSGTVGPSISFGKADAVTILAANAAVADAYATAVGNIVKTEADIEAALEYSSSQPEILGAVIIIGDKIGLRGDLKVVKAQL